MGGRRVERWRRDYIIAHKNDRPRAEVMRAAGVSNGTFYGILHEVGAEMDYSDQTRRVGNIEDIVREMYPTMSPSEIEAVTGINSRYVSQWALKLGLKHTPETTARLREKVNEVIRRPKSAESVRKGARRRRVTLKMEYMRMWCGEPQRTKLLLARISQRAYKARWRLVRFHGYTMVEGEPYTLIRPERLNPLVSERHYEEMYKLKFIDRINYGNETEAAGDVLG